MPYVARDAGGRIVRVEASPSPDAPERLEPHDRELRAFLGQAGERAEVQTALLASDLELIRVLEDLIAILIDKRVIMSTELPKAAQEKLARRYELRSRLDDLGGIVGESEEIMLP